jgi:hypothetical protein
VGKSGGISPVKKWLYGITYILLTLDPRRGSRAYQISESPTFYQNGLAMRNTVDVAGGKPIAVEVLMIPSVIFYACGPYPRA